MGICAIDCTDFPRIPKDLLDLLKYILFNFAAK